MKKYLMRAPILSGFGKYSYKSITLEEARGVLTGSSAIKYQWDADLLRDLLGFYVPINRGETKMDIGDVAVVFEFPDVPAGSANSDKDARMPLCVGLLERTE
jgi:hypothetical protein